ncbi:MAG: amino acid adenylation domain-containing protein, partial [Bacteroidota bacterium]
EKKTGILFLIHHIAIDGTSAAIFSSKLMKLLRQLQEGLNLTPLPVDRHYFDFVLWEQDYLKDKAAMEDMAYWKNKLSGHVEPLALPYDYVPKEEWESMTGVVQSTWTGEELQRLKTTAKSLRVNLSVLLLAAFKVLLYRLTGMENLTVTLPTAGRPKAQYNDSIGFYINMLLSFDRISAEESLSALVDRVKSGFISDIDHLGYPHPRLLTELKLIQGDDDRFPASFVYQNIFDKVLEGEKANTISWIETVEQEIINAYALEVMDVRDRLILKLKYRKDRFLEGSINRHLRYYEQTLKTVISDATVIIREIELLAEEEKHRLLYAFNQTQADYPKDKTLVELFEEQVKQTPEDIALVFEEEQWTYEQLNKVSNQIGGYLRETYHIQSDDRVGIKLERGAWMVAAILGILKSGGAYVPIDGKYPQGRINYMIEDSDCKVVLDRKELEKFQWVKQNYSNENLLTQTKSYHLAYVIYTSGSTGKPKGVMVEHHSVNALVKNVDYVTLDTDTILLQNASISFDAATFEIWGSLLNGGSLVINSDSLGDVFKLEELISNQEINTVFMTPALFDEFSRSLPRNLSSLSQLVLGGDIPNSTALEAYMEKHPNTELYNGYGPTECTTFSTVKPLNLEDVNARLSLSIGMPISNTQTYILDTHMHLVPVGVSGELCIAGAGLARGYLNRPELTAEKFVKNPFGEGRLYKTGDLARWLPDGNIEFLGRMDHQVKIRGYRIELGEIETVLNSYETIQHAVVIAKEHTGSKQLVAYCVPKKEGEELEVEKLKSYLSKSLPEYMIPAFFIPIDEIPLTSNGKTERKALMVRELEVTSTSEYVAPSTETEKQLAAIWQEVLGVEQVGIHDNFFELGGNSLLAISLVHRIKNRLDGTTFSLKEMIGTPTVSKQALFIDAIKDHDQDAATDPHIIVFKRSKRSKVGLMSAFLIIPGMPGVVDDYHQMADQLSAGSVYGMQMQGVLEGEHPLKSMEEMAMHNLRSIKKIRCKKIGLVAHSFGGLVIYEMLRQLQQEATLTVEQVILIDCFPTIWKTRVEERIKEFILAICESFKLVHTKEEAQTFAKKLIRQPKPKRNRLLHEYLTEKGAIIAKEFFERLYHLYNTSMDINYRPKGKLDYEVTLIKAANSLIKNEDPTLGWSPYYRSVKIIESEGDHFEVVKAPFVSVWMEKVKSKSINQSV